MKRNKVYIGLSGGVDSSVAAWLLKEKGYEVTGFTLKLWRDDRFGEISEIEAAAKSAAFLGIPHTVFDLSDEFEKTVIGDFKREYRAGRTPNPCIVCNKHIKFGKVFELVPEEAYVATGHYSKIVYENGLFKIKRSADPKKDQTYMHYNFTQKELSRVIFPLGDYTKEQVRKIAERVKLPSAASKDSQDICFIRDIGYKEFLEKHFGVTDCEGDFLDTSGKVIGRHKGILSYTVGQRKGLGASFGKPMFVTAVDVENNTVTLGEAGEEFTEEIKVRDYNFIYRTPTEPECFGVKVRYSQFETMGVVIPGKDYLTVKFKSPVRAAAPGQSAVFYEGDYLFGGGIIV